MATKPKGLPYGGDDLVDYLISGYWLDDSDNEVSTYTWIASWGGYNVSYNISGFTTSETQNIREALNLWSDVANISFNEVSSGADLTITEGDDNRAFSRFTEKRSAGGTKQNIYKALVSIDTDHSSYDDIDTYGSYGFMTVLHEIGHALGLGWSTPNT